MSHNGVKLFFHSLDVPKTLPNLTPTTYSHLSNNRRGWNKHGGSAKVAKLINVEVVINVEGGFFWKKLVHKSNKRGVEGGKI